jgi:disulfide oxidoreductase YuzD
MANPRRTSVTIPRISSELFYPFVLAETTIVATALARSIQVIGQTYQRGYTKLFIYDLHGV